MVNDANNTNMGLLEQVKLVAENRFKMWVQIDQPEAAVGIE